MYLGLVLVLLGWFIILENLVSLLLLVVFFIYVDRFQIRPEERVLLEKFGSDFCQYCCKVRRWV